MSKCIVTCISNAISVTCSLGHVWDNMNENVGQWGLFWKAKAIRHFKVADLTLTVTPVVIFSTSGGVWTASSSRFSYIHSPSSYCEILIMLDIFHYQQLLLLVALSWYMIYHFLSQYHIKINWETVWKACVWLIQEIECLTNQGISSQWRKII